MNESQKRYMIIVIEPDFEGITVYDAGVSEEAAESELRKIWENDIAIEVNQSARAVDFVMSCCDDREAQICYKNNDKTVIRYFLEEESEKIMDSRMQKQIDLGGKNIHIGSEVAMIRWTRNTEIDNCMVDTRVMVIGETFLVCVHKNGKMIEIELKEIKEIVLVEP